MSVDVKVRFYDVARCGYFEFGSKTPAFGDLASSVAQLQTWAGSVGFGESRTFGDLDSTRPEEEKSIYCFDIAVNRTKGSYAIVLWNRYPTHEGNIPCADAGGTIGQVSVTPAPTPKNTIPGIPAYFWVIPDENLVAQVRFGSVLSSKTILEMYLRNFMRFFGAHGVEESGDSENPIAGYLDSAGNFIKARAHFDLALATVPHNRAWLRRNRGEIVKVIEKVEIDSKTNQHRQISRWRKLSRFLFEHTDGTTDASSDRLKFTCEINICPNDDQLKELVSEFDSDPDHVDVGFVFRGHPNVVHWLRKSLVKTETSLNINVAQGVVVSASTLLDRLERKRDELLKDARSGN